MRRDKQRILATLLALVLLLALAPAGLAEGEIEVSPGGAVSLPAAGMVITPGAYSVTVNLAPSDKPQEFADEVKNAKVQADLYLVAKAVKDPQYDTYSYDFTGSAFASLETDIKTALVADPEKQNDQDTMLKKFAPIAQGAIKIVKAGSATVNKSSEATTTTSISVSGLDGGMYLLVLRGSDLKPDDSDEGYFKTVEKEQGESMGESGEEASDLIVTRALTDSYEFVFEPQLITLPTKMLDGKQSYNTAYGTWENDLSITAKPDWKERNGILKITKTLTNYVDLSKDGEYFEPATFSFSIEGKNKDGKVVYQREVSLSVTSNVSEKEVVTLDDIPIGTVVTITESYTGSHYDINGSATREVTIQAPKTEIGTDGTEVVTGDEVNFSNSGNNTHRGGHGVENKFEFHESEWQWVVDGEVQAPDAEVER
ncbi:MAG: hypothetical protein IJV40_02525 [Oscillospiraceae bacterium]|nr:hypothetical protein [Oscillospiraceae bacterium]